MVTLRFGESLDKMWVPHAFDLRSIQCTLRRMKYRGLSFLRHRATLALFAVLSSLLLTACAESRGSRSGGGSGVVTLNADEGVVFASGEILPGDKFNQVDLLATDNGDRLRLATGGATTTKPNPVNWFPASGGLYQMFESLDDVPADKPTDSTGTSMLKTTSGYGFVIQNYVSEGYTVGWIQSSSPTEVIIEYEVID